MTVQLPDVQAGDPDVEVGLSQVGVTGVEKLVELSAPDSLGPDDRPLVLTAEFEVYVDLPQGRKGIDMSRNMEVIDETLESALEDTPSRVEDLCGVAAERLIEKHDYTSTATVKMEAEYMVREETPASGRSTQGMMDVIASATATEGEPLREEVGVRVTGMTVCPCSQQMMSGRAGEKLRDLGVDGETVREFLEEVPQAGHSQRGHATITLETTNGAEVDLREVADVARDAMSARIYNMAKRPDEDHMTYHAHANARFVEDCVRAMAEGVVDRFRDLPPETVVTMKQRNEESIHQHDAHAQRVAELGTLREEVD